jgi:hypothetical protein
MELAWHLVKGGHADTIRASDGERIDGRQAAPFAAEVQGRQFIRIVAYCFVALYPASSGVGQGWRPHQIQTRNRPKPGPRKDDLVGSRNVPRLRRSVPRRRIRPLLMWHQLQRAESFRASSPTSRYGARFKTPHQNPQSLTHLRGRQSDRRCGRQSEGIKHPNRRGPRDSRLTKTRRWLRERRPRHTKRPARNQMTGAFRQGR